MMMTVAPNLISAETATRDAPATVTVSCFAFATADLKTTSFSMSSMKKSSLHMTKSTTISSCSSTMHMMFL
jgi:hypothetical protein